MIGKRQGHGRRNTGNTIGGRKVNVAQILSDRRASGFGYVIDDNDEMPPTPSADTTTRLAMTMAEYLGRE